MTSKQEQGLVATTNPRSGVMNTYVPRNGFPPSSGTNSFLMNSFHCQPSVLLLPPNNLSQHDASSLFPPEHFHHLSGLWWLTQEKPSAKQDHFSGPAKMVMASSPVDYHWKTHPDNMNNLQTSLSSDQNNPTEPKNNPPKLSPFGNLIQQHGDLVLHTYWGVYLGAFAGFFAGFESGWLDPMRLYHGSKLSTVLAKSMRLPAVEPNNLVMANFFLAWLFVEALEPLRVQATVALVPTLATLAHRTVEGEVHDKPQDKPQQGKPKKRRKPLLIPC